MQIGAFIFILVTLVGTVVGQLAIKSGMLQIASGSEGTMSLVSTLLSAFTNLRVLFGLGMAVVAACSWMLALSRLPLSYAYPFLSVTFPIVVVLSSAVFKEPVPFRAYLGLLLIVVGLVVTSTGSQ